MSETASGLIVRLDRLVAVIMKESDSQKYDELGSEIWRVLDELGAQRMHASMDSNSSARIA